LTLAAVKAAFIHKILCFEMFENKSLCECKAPPPLPARRVHLWCIFLALPFKDGPLPAELNFGENTGLDQYILHDKYLPRLINAENLCQASNIGLFA